MKKYYKYLITSILCTAIIIFPAFVPVNAMSDIVIEQGISKFEIFEDYILEYDEVIVNHEKIEIQKYTYTDNTALLIVKEKGTISKFNLSANYNLLKENLNSNISLGQLTRAGLVEKYLTTFKSTDHVTPKNGTYSIILAAVSGVLSFVSFPASVVTSIASALYGINSSAVEAWITTERKFYEVYDSTGYFLGYYKVYYTVKTEAKVNGRRQLIDTQRGNYTTLFPG